MSRIQATISDQFKVLFRNVTDQSIDEIHNRKRLFDICVVFVAVIVERNRLSIIVVNSGGGDYGSAKIAANIFGDNFRVTEIGFGIDIEALFMLAVAVRFHLFERRSNPVFQFIEKSSPESVAEEVIVKIFYMTPEAIITVTAFGKKAVNVRIPFQIPAESVENHDVSGSKILGMIEVEKHTGYHAGNRVKEAV